MRLNEKLGVVAMLLTMILIVQQNVSAEMVVPKDTIELNTVYIDQTVKDIKPKVFNKSDGKISGMDLVKLTRAVARAETGNGTQGHGAAINNICGIMHWPNGKGSRTPVVYKTYIDGFNACHSLIKRKYQDYTIKGMANRWTGNDRADTWASNVEYWYNK